MNNLIGKYLNPLTDFGFKKLFGSEPNKDFLIDFLNQILPAEHQIETLTYAQNEHLGQSEIDRKAIFDLYCVGASGERFIVEIQKAKQNYFKDRSVFYATFPIQEQAKSGDWNFKLTPVYTIGILDFTFDETRNDRQLLHQVELKDQNNKIFYDKLKFIYIELPKFNKTENELITQFDKWLYILKHLSELQNRPVALQEKIFKKFFETAEIAKFTPSERQVYENSLKYYRDIKNVVDTSKEEGIKEGKQKGEKEKAVEIALNLISLKMDEDTIAKATGLSIVQIQELRNSK